MTSLLLTVTKIQCLQMSKISHIRILLMSYPLSKSDIKKYRNKTNNV
jgi:hypothetical protein